MNLDISSFGHLILIEIICVKAQVHLVVGNILMLDTFVVIVFVSLYRVLTVFFERATSQKLLIASRNLEFFTNGYRYLIQILPAAVVAPMYFSGKIEFGVINQSVSAFNHILGDFSIIVYQFQAISAFSAIIDRLGIVLILLFLAWLYSFKKKDSERGSVLISPLLDKIIAYMHVG